MRTQTEHEDAISEYRFLQFCSDPIRAERAIPSLMGITSESREHAIQEFARQFGLNVDSNDGDTVWFVRDDGMNCEYVIVQSKGKAPTEW